MKSAPFDYVAPRTVAEAISCLDAAGNGGRLLAGGQSLMPLMVSRSVSPAVVIDLTRVGELDHITPHVDGGVVIGATTRQRTVERSTLIAERVPLLTSALPHIAHAAVRNRGTIGGSIAFADPGAELPVVAVAADATMIVAGRDGRRAIPAAEFFVGRLENSLRAGELLVEIYFPPLPANSVTAFAEYSRRPGDPALAAAAVVVQSNGAGRIAESRLVLGGVGDTPVRAASAEAVLIGVRPQRGVFARAASEAIEGLQPHDDLHATGAYRRHLAGIVLRRALSAAFATEPQ